MKIDIDKLDEAELIELNRPTAARLKHLRKARTCHQMLSVNVRDRMRLHPPGTQCGDRHHRQVPP
ncbi:hypothetical protein OOT46_24395 [Aquabacterium sp. A7-Y]|uniref:hypothetical protein n=1 Tax=Aquabacterium sp. A7-Y TaxID=1349605 RepID=UPI00223E6787|nr:hypothetical protein [Aquabacterium sp. A7-Y]MCW7540966.1 hypothetical protein [Aquabacterium sp. A7-Y]